MSDKKPFGQRKLLKPSFFFILVGLILLFLFPRDAKFKYEFSKGKPWQHERLIAPFSFAIEKTEEQIKSEKDSIQRNKLDYFVWDNSKNKLKRQELLESLRNDSSTSLSFFIIDSLLIKYNSEYIIDPVVLERINRNEIAIIESNNSKIVPIQSLYTPKKIFLEIQIKTKEILQEQSLFYDDVFDKIHIENYIVSNLEYNSDLSLEFLNQKIAKVSTTTGLIQKGELIISTGELIGENDFNILRSFRLEYQKRYSGSGSYNRFLGNILIILAPLLLLFSFLFQHRKKILLSSKKTIFILSNTLLFIVIILLNTNLKIAPTYIVPIIILPIVIRAFFDARLASFIYIITLLLTAYLVPNSYEFIYIQMITGIIAVYSLSQVTKRSHIFRTSIIVFATYSITFLGLMLIQEDEWTKIPWISFAYFAGNSLMLMLSYPIVYLFERLFGFTSDLTLLELSDTNQKLLKSLSEKAPGTFQHSLQVANIAEEIIRTIGGNPLLVRTGALYHDIGKIKNPQYFTENQSQNFNPHDNLSPIESAKVIIKHVEDGISLAKKNKLPQSIVDFIPMHQGTLTAKYFYTKYKNENPEEQVDERLFSYPGPKPFSKETAAVMIADAIEAASRSLQTYSPETIKNLIDKIIDYQLGENQFENVHMTFKDIKNIKLCLIDKLSNIYHSRIAYPEERPLVKK
jgi:putative nucleotidyltransferase with HDIG domain